MLVTAGPTREHLDPVRFLTNGSSGRMGYALAGAAARRGASVVLVSGPAGLPRPSGVRFVPVTTAEEMRRASLRELQRTDLVLAAAAVGDWRFERRYSSKIHRKEGPWSVRLVPNPDILAEMARRRGKGGRPVLIGFALETGAWLRRAKAKMLRKAVDAVVANRPDSLGGKRGRVALLDRRGGCRVLPPGTKEKLAESILSFAEGMLS